METKHGDGPNMNWDQFLDDLRAVVQDGEDLLKTGFGRAREQATVRAQAADRVVHDRPYQSLALGFGLGLVAGFLLHRSFRQRAADQQED